MKIEKNENALKLTIFQGIIIFLSFISFHLNKKREKEARRQLEVRDSRTYNDKKVHCFSATMTMIIITTFPQII